MKKIKEEIAEDEAEENVEKYKVIDVDVDMPQPEVLQVMEASSLFNVAAKKKKGILPLAKP